MAQMQIFLSHSSKDKAFADQHVAALRGSGADVWYDEDGLGPGVLRRQIMDQLVARPIVIVVLSKAALTSEWAQEECDWAYTLLKREPDRMILRVVAALYEPRDFNAMLYLEGLRRIEAPGNRPYPPAEAIARTLRLLELTPAGHRAAPTSSMKKSETYDDLVSRGVVLSTQGKYADAVSSLERARNINPRGFDAWALLGLALRKLNRPDEALAACDRALALDPNIATAWSGKGNALWDLKRYEDAVVAYTRATSLDPGYRKAWHNLALTLRALGRKREAEEAERRAKALDS